GSVLSKRPAAHLAWLVCAANAALVPRGCRWLYRRRGNRIRMVALPSTPLSHRLFPRRHLSSTEHHSHRQLRFPELPGPRAGIFTSRRSLPRELLSKTLDHFRVPEPDTVPARRSRRPDQSFG